MEAVKNTSSNSAKIVEIAQGRAMETEIINDWVKGNQHAATMLRLLGEASQVADDLADGDSEDPSASMARLLSIQFVELMTNPFFMQNLSQFVPIFATSIQIWSVTDELGRSDNKEKQAFGFVYREILEQIITLTAYLIGGQEHARAVTKEMIDYYHSKDQDSMEEWVREVQNV